MPRILSPAQIEGFARDGFVAPIRAISAERARYYRDRLEGFERAYPEARLKLDQKAHMICPWVDEMIREPQILDATEDLIGPDILCWGTSLRAKAADGKTFAGWHQDTAYADVRPIVVIVALALSPSRAENGCIRAIPGSHQGPLLPHKEAFKTDSLLSREQYIDAPLDHAAAVDLALEPGEIALFNNAIIHGSKPNFGEDRRILFLLEMVPTHAYQHSPRESAILVRGQDAYGNFDPDPPPRQEMGAAELAAWERAVAIQASVLFRGAERPPRALAGMTSGRPPGGS
ncbi:MAG: phytanoyl-CoA dioxygenase family protein [Alphaproteobacteria bacterium]|nr:phytanoyl-CoA dioxygenase family protein [Alphaproteobacteria bacterium]